MPNVIVTDIEFNDALNKIYVSTFGGGIWETRLSDLVSIPDAKNSSRQIELYPTINDGNFSLDFNNSDADLDDCELEVIDIKGRLVSRSNIIGKGIVKQQLSLAPGKYYVRLSFAESTWVKSFVVK